MKEGEPFHGGGAGPLPESCHEGQSRGADTDFTSPPSPALRGLGQGF